MARVVRHVVLGLACMALAFTAGGSAPALAATTRHSLAASRQGPAEHMSSAFLSEGEELGPGASIASGTVKLIMQYDGNLVLYNKQTGGSLWASGTRGDNTVIMQGDGDLVIYPTDQVGNSSLAEWATNTYGYNVLVVQDDENVVIYPSCCVGDPAVAQWATNTES